MIKYLKLFSLISICLSASAMGELSDEEQQLNPNQLAVRKAYEDWYNKSPSSSLVSPPTSPSEDNIRYKVYIKPYNADQNEGVTLENALRRSVENPDVLIVFPGEENDSDEYDDTVREELQQKKNTTHKKCCVCFII